MKSWKCPNCDSEAVEVQRGTGEPIETTLRCSIGRGGCGSETIIVTSSTRRNVWEHLA
jgi:hypothetical protein